jgi:hypothetical protein
VACWVVHERRRHDACEKQAVVQVLRDEPKFSKMFMANLEAGSRRIRTVLRHAVRPFSSRMRFPKKKSRLVGWVFRTEQGNA